MDKIEMRGLLVQAAEQLTILNYRSTPIGKELKEETQALVERLLKAAIATLDEAVDSTV